MSLQEVLPKDNEEDTASPSDFHLTSDRHTTIVVATPGYYSAGHQ
jgi:hypothetical protein